jgi:hypothetical protein
MEEKAMRFEFQVNLKKVWYVKRAEKVPKSRKLNLRNSLLLAYQMQDYIETGKVKALVDFCKWINISHSRICQIIKLLLLAPDIQEEILLKDTELFIRLTERYIRKIPLQVIWQQQRVLWENITKLQTKGIKSS